MHDGIIARSTVARVGFGLKEGLQLRYLMG